MKLFRRELTGYAKQLVIASTIMLVASGLCGVQWMANRAHWSGNGPISAVLVIVFMFAGVAELLLIGASALWIAFIVLAWPVSILHERLTGRQRSGLQGLLDSDKAQPHDDDGIEPRPAKHNDQR